MMPDEKLPSSETHPTPLPDFIREAEQARAFLQTELDYAHGGAIAGLEMLLFYGRVFAQVIQRLSRDAGTETWQERLLQEAVVGRTAHWEWQRRTTNIIASRELSQMQTRWGNIVAITAETFG